MREREVLTNSAVTAQGGLRSCFCPNTESRGRTPFRTAEKASEFGFSPNSEMELGGTGNLPVPLGHRPNGTERRLATEQAIRKSLDPPFRSDRRVAGRDRRVACATHREDACPFGIRV